MRRLLSVLLALAVMLLAAPAPARADSETVTASTSLYLSSDAKRNNVDLAANALSCVRLDYGDSFSFNDMVGPRDAYAGYEIAPNGRGVDVYGGGVAQVATTLYLTLLQLDDIEYNSLYTYGGRFADNYVSDGYYAVVTDYDNEIDFAFTNYCSGVLTIYLWADDENVTCLITREDDGGGNANMIGYAATPLYGNEAKISNISLAASSIFGATLTQYDQFSFNGLVGPRVARSGYQSAINGRGVNVVGGGVAQVASTVYLAVKELDCVSVTEKSLYTNFTEYYVSDMEDAICTDFNNGVDFAFCYTGYGTLVLYTYVTDTEVVCEVYEY